MSPAEVVRLGGTMHLFLAVFHLLFWRLFGWRADLRRLSRINRGIVPVLNLCLTFVFLLFAYLSLVHAGELTTGASGRALLVGIAGFWTLRAVLQPFFFPLRSAASLVLLAVFLLLGLGYGWAALSTA